MLRFRSGRARNWVHRLALLFLLGSTSFVCGAEGKPAKHKKNKTTAEESASPGEQSLTNIPLPVGHEAKGLVLPDFDADGRLRGRFEAGTATRVDENHMRLLALNMTTFTPENATDLRVQMSDSLLDLTTRILKSEQRSTVTRSDFNIVGDTIEFDTVERKGTMHGHVKMVITNVARLTAKEGAKGDE